MLSAKVTAKGTGLLAPKPSAFPAKIADGAVDFVIIIAENGVAHVFQVLVVKDLRPVIQKLKAKHRVLLLFGHSAERAQVAFGVAHQVDIQLLEQMGGRLRFLKPRVGGTIKSKTLADLEPSDRLPNKKKGAPRDALFINMR
ncbi:hypothetical protein [Ruegeria arenilitoris]|uniref:hypothetical protein n=1 Tax=Ruegeria arenilitoris TaxID=1173585 RepID=UPI00147AE3D5|nr:hypothetical protein [Ruegeria arenilitoris]